MTIARQLHNSKTHARGNDPNCPVCTRHALIADTLERINAGHLSAVDGPNRSTLSFYALPGGRVVIVQQYDDDHGFEIYRPAHDGNKTADTIDALLAYAEAR